MHSSRARTASGCPVMLTSDQPCAAKCRDSARVEKRGPSTTTIVPPSSTESSAAATALDSWRAVRVGERHVHRTGLHEALDAAVGPVDELVGHDHVAGGDVGTKTADGAGGEDLANSQRAQRPEVGPVVDPVRRELMPGPVPRQERHPPPRDDAERDRRGGIAVRRLDPDRLRILEERVEATPADHGNVGSIRYCPLRWSRPPACHRRVVLPSRTGRTSQIRKGGGPSVRTLVTPA